MKKVLLINDDPDFKLLITSYLKRKGFESKSIDATDTLIPLIDEFNPHVIVVDMKADTDKNICNEIREKSHTKAKIILLTDKAVRSSDAHKCKPDLVLQKPFKPQELIEKLEQ